MTLSYRTVIIALFSYGLVLSAFAGSPAFTGTPYEVRYRAMQAACLDRHWSEEKLTISPPVANNQNYRMTPLEEKAGDASLAMFRVPVRLFRQAEKASTGKTTAAERQLDALITELKNFADDRKLNTWQRACLSTCVSSHMIDPIDTLRTGLLIQPARILEEGEGVCKQYAMLGETFGDALGVETKVVSNGTFRKTSHVYLKVKIGTTYYYMEPQQDQCELFNL